MSSAERFSVEGITDEVTVCDHCGKKNLKRTVLLVDNETGDEVYFGTSCAAEALGWKERTPSSQLNRAYREVMELRRKYLEEGARYAESLVPPEVTFLFSNGYEATCGGVHLSKVDKHDHLFSAREQKDRLKTAVVKLWRSLQAEEWATEHGMPPEPKPV